MEEIIRKIKTMSEPELRQVMKAVEDRYRASYPTWDVVYIALHKDPFLRLQEFAELLDMMNQDLQCCQKEMMGAE